MEKIEIWKWGERREDGKREDRGKEKGARSKPQ